MTLTAEQVVVFERTAFAVDLVVGGLAMVLRTAQFLTEKKRSEFSPSLSCFIYMLRPFDYCICLGSIIGSIEFLSKGTVTTPLFTITRISQTFGGNIVRFKILVICFDRILATIFLESYHRWSTRNFGLIFFFIIIACSASITLLQYIFKFDLYNHLVIISLSMNFLTLILLLVLDRRNKKMKKLITEGYNLTTRCQIVENIKILLIVRPYIILMAGVTVLSPITNSVAMAVTDELQASEAVFYVFYNVYFIFCSVFYFKLQLKFAKIENTDLPVEIENNKPMVVTVLGNKLPAATTMDEHFNGLKKEWEGMTKNQ